MARRGNGNGKSVAFFSKRRNRVKRGNTVFSADIRGGSRRNVIDADQLGIRIRFIESGMMMPQDTDTDDSDFDFLFFPNLKRSPV